MNKFDENILKVDKIICDNISKREYLGEELLAQNILAQARNLVNALALRIYSVDNSTEITYPELEKAMRFIRSRAQYSFIVRFYNSLQVSVSHYANDQEASVRLLSFYIDNLQEIRSYVKTTFNLDILANLDSLIITKDGDLGQYYEQIAYRIEAVPLMLHQNYFDDRYYIHKVRPFNVNGEKYYEVTLSLANDYASKFERIIAFTKIRIPHLYAVQLNFVDQEISILDHPMTIRIINNFKISIRPCEFENFFDILGRYHRITTKSNEYRNLMQYLSDTGISLSEVLDFEDEAFTTFSNTISNNAHTHAITEGLAECRNYANLPGYNVLKYLLFRMNNKIIKRQKRRATCDILSNLHLAYGCKPFDDMPYAFDLIKHRTRLSDLFNCIDPRGRKHELLARYIRTNTEINAKLYTPISELSAFEDIQSLMAQHNSNLYYKHVQTSSLAIHDDHLYINGYEKNTVTIIQRLISLAQSGVRDYTAAVEYWLNTSSYHIDSPEKLTILKQLFVSSKVALIYGAAGTGKSTLINHISHYYDGKKKVYLANTNAAIENLKHKVDGNKENFYTISSFLKTDITECDILFIDECSTISNKDMVDILEKVTFKLLVLAGDIYQIESISFGNWFTIAKDYVPKTAKCELTEPHRSTDAGLKNLWKSVRALDGNIQAHLARNSYSTPMDKSIFYKAEADEIVLCLNYDGLYGINNVNSFLQDNNPSTTYLLGLEKYKVGDPIIFNESNRFGKVLYNNLKGTIVGIEDVGLQIQFDISIDMVLDETAIDDIDLELRPSTIPGQSTVRFCVNKDRSTDEDRQNELDVVPFQIAYAVSIHKAQGLEYDSVKIIITNEVEDLISHNIFYTAITRAKKKLKIYWSRETERTVLNNMKYIYNPDDARILARKYNLRLAR